ncbi:MAG: peptidoglycan-associated lipoprotein Pal [Hyphomicrobiales bacterium]
MITSISRVRMLRLASLFGGLLLLAACASDKATDSMSNTGGSLGGAAAPGSAQDFVVSVGDRVFFETDSTDLTSLAIETLDKQAQWLAQYASHAVLIEGHADERGTREYNFALGARRAQAVRDYLAGKGVAGSRLKTVSFGKERPVAVCDDISCWSQNRRAVTTLSGGN